MNLSWIMMVDTITCHRQERNGKLKFHRRMKIMDVGHVLPSNVKQPQSKLFSSQPTSFNLRRRYKHEGSAKSNELQLAFCHLMSMEMIHHQSSSRKWRQIFHLHICLLSSGCLEIKADRKDGLDIGFANPRPFVLIYIGTNHGTAAQDLQHIRRDFMILGRGWRFLESRRCSHQYLPLKIKAWQKNRNFFKWTVKLVHATESWVFNSITIFKEEALRNAIHLTKEGK